MRWYRNLFDWRPAIAARPALSDLFTTTPPAWAFFLDYVAYPLLIAMCIWLALRGNTAAQAVAAFAFMGLGFAIWTLAEYLLHRFILHHVQLFRKGHMAHHDMPRDFIGTPTIASVAIFLVLVLAPLGGALGISTGAALSVGLLGGYLSYVVFHFMLHHGGSGGFAHVRKLKRHHALHHHRANDCNFGVTTMIWDRMFGTLK